MDKKKLHFSWNGTILLALALFGFGYRMWLLPFMSLDYVSGARSWYYYLQHSSFSAFKFSFSDYMPLYHYVLFVASHIFPYVNDIVVIKGISIVFDVLCAFWIYKIVAIRYQDRYIRALSFVVAFISPTLILNSSLWGQSDSIYGAFILASIYFISKHKPFMGLLFFGVALSLKLQAVFLIPFYFVLFGKNFISPRYLIIIFAVIISSFFPSLLAGRSLGNLLSIYPYQISEGGNNLTLNAPNIYNWFTSFGFDQVYKPGLVFGILIICIFCIIAIAIRFNLDRDLLIQFSLLSVLLPPYLLPKMHDRYFFLADCISIIYPFYFSNRIIVPLCIIGSSFFSYFPFLFGKELIPFNILSLFNGFAIILVVYDTYASIKQKVYVENNNAISVP